MDNVFELRDYTLRMAKAKRSKAKTPAREVTVALKALRERAGMTMEELAKGAGYRGASSYQRYEDPNLYKKPYLPPTLVDRLLEILVGRGSPPIDASDVFALGPWGPDEFQFPARINPNRGFPMPVLGEVQAGVWREAGEPLEGPEIGRIPVVSVPWQAEEGQFALLVRGESINRVARDGDYLVCVDLHFTHTTPQAGDLVVVERLRDDGAIREVTVKRLAQEFDGTKLLMPESDDPRFQQAIPLDDPKSADVTVSIRALVLMVLSIKHPTAQFGYNPRK